MLKIFDVFALVFTIWRLWWTNCSILSLSLDLSWIQSVEIKYLHDVCMYIARSMQFNYTIHPQYFVDMVPEFHQANTIPLWPVAFLGFGWLFHLYFPESKSIQCNYFCHWSLQIPYHLIWILTSEIDSISVYQYDKLYYVI